MFPHLSIIVILLPASHAGNVKWYTEPALSLDKALRDLLSIMKEQGWQQWLGSKEKPLASILLEAATYGLCNLPVSRASALACSDNVTWQQLEADAVIELRLTGGTSSCLQTLGPRFLTRTAR